jgi:hypothetical protein
MMRTFNKGYMAPWSNRRETAGLMGTFLVFLLGLPSHSESMVNQARHLVRQLIQLMLVFLGLSAPTAQAPTTVVVKTPPVVKVHVHKNPMPAPVTATVDTNSMFLRSDPMLHHFTYIFGGKATFHGQPCPNASVLIRLNSGERSIAKGTVTEADGSYSVQVAIDAEDKAPVDWTVEAYTSDFKNVELSGRQIVELVDGEEKEPIMVTTPVEFIVSLSKEPSVTPR